MRLRSIFVSLAVVVALVWCIPEGRAAGSLTLTATTDSLEMATSAATNVDWRCSFLDTTTTAATPGSANGQSTTATDTTIVAAPAASTYRKVSGCTIHNTSASVANTITIMFDTSGTERVVGTFTLQPKWTAGYNEETGWRLRDGNGREVSVDPVTSGFGGRTFYYYKVGTAAELVGGRYNYLKDTGTPGAWVPGTPGLNGDALSCDTAADATIAGAHILPDPASGAWYVKQVGMTASTAQLTHLYDLLWYNTGIAVTTTGAQAITHPGVPARDRNGSTNGEGVTAALLATAAIGGGAVTNTTLSYTDQDGNAGNTATLASWNATSVVGTMVEFQLAAGDRGIRSIESLTLGTTYTSGSLSLIQYRPLISIPNPLANVGGVMSGLSFFEDPGFRIWNDTCLGIQSTVSATTLTNVTGTVTVIER